MANTLRFCVDIDGPIAVYVQIENQVRFAIASGRLKPADTLPSVRAMSTMLDVNPNTVTKSYRDLELMQLVRTRRGVGVTVTEKAPKLCQDSVPAMTRQHLRDAVAECSVAGLSAAEIRKVVSDTLESGVAPYEGAKE